MLISMIAAVAENGVIGAANQLPWHVPEDLAYFKQVTMGKPIIMGRKTFDSVERPLPGRQNIVITRRPGYAAEGVVVVMSLSEALDVAADYCEQRGCDEVMIAGGAEIYRLALPVARRIYITEISQRPEGDTYFPAIDSAEWTQVSSEPAPSGACVFKVLERLDKPAQASSAG